MIDNNLDHLSEPCKTKSKVFLTIAKQRLHNLAPFETLRTLDRQKWLVANHKSWTMNSYHLKGEAVDRVFTDQHGNPTWQGDYNEVHYIGAFCGLVPISVEQCHLQDDGRAVGVVMNDNSKLWHTSSPDQQALLHSINEEFKKYVV